MMLILRPLTKKTMKTSFRRTWLDMTKRIHTVLETRVTPYWASICGIKAAPSLCNHHRNHSTSTTAISCLGLQLQCRSLESIDPNASKVTKCSLSSVLWKNKLFLFQVEAPTLVLLARLDVAPAHFLEVLLGHPRLYSSRHPMPGIRNLRVLGGMHDDSPLRCRD